MNFKESERTLVENSKPVIEDPEQITNNNLVVNVDIGSVFIIALLDIE